MPKICYQKRNFQVGTLDLIQKADDIMTEYSDQGYDLTLRQLYYQFVARGFIPNKQSEYKRLGSAINDGRLAGYLDWEMLVDRTREMQQNSHWDGPGAIVSAAASSFALDKWSDQNNYVEVWVEKEALAGVVSSAASPLDVPRFSCRGYVSQSEMWRAAGRFRNFEQKGKTCYVLHLGDHDPSGIDMTRDIQDRLHVFRASVIVKRIALNMDQIEELKPVPNPAKLTDARAHDYIRRFGYDSWELDALDPSYLDNLIRQHVQELCDQERFDARRRKQEHHRKTLTTIQRYYDEIVAFLQNEGFLSD